MKTEFSESDAFWQFEIEECYEKLSSSANGISNQTAVAAQS